MIRSFCHLISQESWKRREKVPFWSYFLASKTYFQQPYLCIWTPSPNYYAPIGRRFLGFQLVWNNGEITKKFCLTENWTVALEAVQSRQNCWCWLGSERARAFHKRPIKNRWWTISKSYISMFPFMGTKVFKDLPNKQITVFSFTRFVWGLSKMPLLHCGPILDTKRRSNVQNSPNRKFESARKFKYISFEGRVDWHS